MSSLTICPGDNLNTLRTLAAAGTRFDLVELDGPYGAGLEAWDCLTPDEYLAHYTERLTLVRQVLQPWGVVFVFGYSDWLYRLAAWADTTNTLYLRRWVHWYVQQTAHNGRRIQSILVLTQTNTGDLLAEFRGWLKARRLELGLSLRTARTLTGVRADMLDNPKASSGGYFWYETVGSGFPTQEEYASIRRVFGTPRHFDTMYSLRAFAGVTDRDFITVPVERAIALNDEGLRSKPLGLYAELFTPLIQPYPERAALILYGGSGNAAIAAGQLGYTVTCCETDAGRCEHIRRAWAAKVERRDVTPHAEYGPLFAGLGVA